MAPFWRFYTNLSLDLLNQFYVGCSCAKDVYIAKVVIWTFALVRLLKNQEIQSHAEVLLWDCKYLERNDL